MTWFFLLLPVILLLLVYRYETSRRLVLLKKIPGLKGWPVAGVAFDFLLTPEQLFRKLRSLYKTYKGLNVLYSFGDAVVNIYDPEDIEVILSSTRFNGKQIPYTFLGGWLGQGLLTSNGNKWLKRRKMLTPAFHFNILKKYTKSFIDQSDELLRAIDDECEKEICDLVPLISKATLRIMCETAMGIPMGKGMVTKSNKYLESLYTLGECIVQRICRTWYYNDFVYNLSPIAKNEATALVNLHNFTDNVIKERKESIIHKDVINETNDDFEMYGKKGKLAMLDLLLQHEREGNIDLLGIREEVDTFMFEGHDTTAMAISFFILSIADKPEIQDKIYEELKVIFYDSDRKPTMEDLNEMKYLECCLKETLRMFPSVPLIARHIGEEIVLGGYTIPANVDCYIHIYDLHHRADIYPEPEKFIPERFLPENVLKRHRYSYIPFSAGPRNCIGQKFAMLEMKILMSSLLRRFRVEPLTGCDIPLTTDVVLRNLTPVYVHFRRRF